MSLTLGSLFDGIGGWLLAALHNGVKPVWASEIDEFPAAVTAHHFPEVKQLGDITKIDPDKLEPVDIICAGSPCQDLSVAGKRAGLEGERSGLFHTAIRLVHELRARTGKPRYFVWENVPGAFSSNKGLDFRAVLEEISETEIPMPKDNKWAPAGVVEWDGGSIAWRTLDAQYWGVPQRRKRIFLVADFAGASAGQILLEPEGLHGHTSESEGEREGTAADAGTGSDGTGRAVTLTMRAGKPGGGKGPLVKDELSLALSTQNTQTVFENVNIYDLIGRENQNGGHQMGIGQDVSYTLNTVDRHAVAVGYRASGFQSYSEDKVAGTLRAEGGTAGGGQRNLCNQRKVGCLNARDYKGVGSQYVDEGKLVIDD